MGVLTALAALLLAASAPLAPPAAGGGPSTQALIFHNARLAERDKHPAEVLKLWLLHNTVENQKGERGANDPDFLSVVWAALGDTAYCPDGLREDEHGAGLWPLALHNWFVRNLSLSEPAPDPSPFDAFDLGQQERLVSLHDVLSRPELKDVAFFRGECLTPLSTAVQESGSWPDLKDRGQVAQVLRALLRQSKATLLPEKIDQRAAIDARIFDLDLLIASMKSRDAKRRFRAARQQARSLGVAAPTEPPLALSLPPDSEEGKILRASLHWTPEAWLSLSGERRLFLFSQARPLSTDPAETDALILSLIDALIERRAGAEVEQWIALYAAEGSMDRRRAVFGGERGRRLLALDKTTGLRERPALALHRGVTYLAAGELDEAMRSFAYALSHADESREPAAVLGLSRRWLSFVLSRHESTEHVITALVSLVPRHEYNAIIEDLVWRAALTTDTRSFELCLQNAKGSSAFITRARRLEPLAAGKLADFANQLKGALTEEPFLTLRFIRQLVERLEAEDAEVRKAQTPTLQLLVKVLAPLAASGGTGGAAQERSANELISRVQAVLEGLEELDAARRGERGPRSLAPGKETFAGSIRLAPGDPLPWPFALPDVEPPAAIAQLGLVPVEWKDAAGNLVMGWRIGE